MILFDKKLQKVLKYVYMNIERKGLLKKFIVMLASLFLVAGAFLFNACSPKKNYGKFTEKQIVLSVNDRRSFADIYDMGDFEISFLSSDNDVVKIEGEELVAVAPGNALIYGVFENNKVNYLKVNVKNRFEVPTNIEVSDSGLISWKRVVQEIDGQEVYAKYEMKISGGNFYDKVIPLNDNYYQLSQKGEYSVSIRAVSTDTVDASPWSEEVVLYYDIMERPSEFVFVNSKQFQDVKGELRWKEIPGAKFNVVVGGVLYTTNTNQIEINLANYKGDSVEVYVEAVDLEGKKMNSKSGLFVIEKLNNPTIEYVGGGLRWKEVAGAEKYFVKVISLKDGSTNIFETLGSVTYLEGIEEGKYQVFVQAIGEGDKCNSDLTGFGEEVVKLKECEISFTKSGNNVKVKLSSDNEYTERFKLLFNGEEHIVNVSERGEKFVGYIDFTLQDSRVYNFSAQILPSQNNGEIVEFDGNKNVINSNFTQEISIYKLAEVGGFKHQLDGEGRSIIEFDKVENAEIYNLEINGILLSDLNMVEHENKVTIDLGILNRDLFEINDGGRLIFRVFAEREDNSNTINSFVKHTIKVLTSPTTEKIDGVNLGGNIYSWDAVEGAKYKYILYKTADSLFDINGIEGKEFIVEQNSTHVLPEGFYKIKVYSLSADDNVFFGSKNAWEDNFIVSKQCEQPTITSFTYDETLVGGSYSGYKIKFNVPRLAGEEDYRRDYEIYINNGEDDVLLSKAEAIESKEYTYNFTSEYNFSNAMQRYQIKIRLICRDSELAKVYTPSNYSILRVKKLATPSKDEVDINDQKLRILSKDDTKEVAISKDGNYFMDGEKFAQEMDLSSFVGNFELKISYMGYEESSDGVLNAIFLTSDEFILYVARDMSPSNLSYLEETISFEHAGKAENFILQIKITTENDPNGKTWIYQMTGKSVNMNTLLQYFVNDYDFATYFNQKTALYLEVSADINKFIDDTYYIPSKNNTENDGVAKLKIDKLSRINTLSFDKDSNSLAWNSTNPIDTIYEVYLNNQKIKEIALPNLSDEGINRYVYSLDSSIFREDTDYQFFVIAKKINCIESNNSNLLVINKVSSLKSVEIYSDLIEGKVYMGWSLQGTQINKAKNISINGTEQELSVSKLELNKSTEEFSIKLIGRDSYTQTGITYAFMDSEIAVFTITKAEVLGYQANLTNDDYKLSWAGYNDVTGIFNGVVSPANANYGSLLKYRVYVYAEVNGQEVTYYKDLGNVNNLNLNDELFTRLNASSYKVNVFAYLDRYIISNNGRGVYCYQRLAESDVDLNKLNSVTNLKYQYLSEERTSTIEDELDRLVRISWDFDNNAIGETRFKVIITKTEGDPFVAYTTNTYFDVALGDKDVQIIVIPESSKDIAGERVSCQIEKLSNPSYSISSLGILTINNYLPTNKYLVEVDNLDVKETLLLEGNSVDIFEYFKSTSPAFDVISQTLEVKVRVIAVGEGDIISSGITENTYTGLGVGQMFTKADKIYFYNLAASSVNIKYEYNGEIKSEKLTQKKTLYCLNINEHHSGANQIYYVEDPTIFNYSAGDIREISGFEFTVPGDLTSLKFVYSFEKEGYVSSWYDDTLTESNEYNIERLEDINDVIFNIDTTSLKEGFWVENETGKASNGIHVTIKYVEQEREVLLAEINIEENYYSFEDLENLLKNNKLEARTYEVEVNSIKRFNEETKTFAFSNSYRFNYTRQDNTIFDVKVGESGFVEWQDGVSGTYDVRFNSGNYLTKVKLFDARVTNDTEFKIVKLGQVPHGEKWNKSSSISSLANGGVIIGESNAKNYNLSQLLDGIYYTGNFTVLETTESGEIYLRVSDSKDYRVFVEYANKVYEVPRIKTYENGNYLLIIKLIDIIDAIGGDFTENITSVKLSTVESGKIKSMSIGYSVSLKKKESVSASLTQLKAGDYVSEYIEFSSSVTSFCNLTRVKVMSGQTIVYEGIKSLLKGYWLESDDTQTGFYATNPGGGTYVCVLDVTELLEEIDMPMGDSYKIFIAPIQNENHQISQIEWLGGVDYYRINGVEEINVSQYGEKIIWEDIQPDDKAQKYLLVVSSNGIKEKYCFDCDVFEMDYSFFNENNEYTIEVFAVSNNPGEFSSKAREITSVIKNSVLNKNSFSVTYGVMFMHWGSGALTSYEIANLHSTEAGVVSDQINEIFDSRDFLKILNMIFERNYQVGITTLELVDKLSSITYKSPFNFRFDTIKEELLQMKFLIEGEREHLIDVKAVDILDPINESYINILKDLLVKIPYGYPQYTTINKLVRDLQDEDRYKGISNAYHLFDNLGNGRGEDVLGDVYSINIRQLGNATRRGLQSNDNKIFESMEVLSAPKMSLTIEDINNDEGEVLTSKFFLNFVPVNDKEGNLKTEYIAIFNIGGMVSTNIIAEIKKEGDLWAFCYNETSLTLEEVDGKVVIPLNKGGIEEIIDFGESVYFIQIFAMGSDTQLNGKSDLVKIAYLKDVFPKMSNGELYWTSTRVGIKYFDTNVIYQKRGMLSYQTKLVRGGNYSMTYSPEAEGNYNFVALLNKGYVDGFEAYIDSNIKLVRNLSKLYAPTVSVENGEFKIQDTMNEFTEETDGYIRQYKISNNSSSLYLTTYDMGEVDFYKPGVNSYTGEFLNYKKTEQNAGVFKFQNIGTNSDFILREGDETDSLLGTVQILELENQKRVFFKSNIVNIDAQMLEETSIRINDIGDFEWDEISLSNRSGIVAVQSGNREHKVIYEVSIEVYRKVISAGTGLITYVIDESLSKKIYTEKNYLASTDIMEINDGTSYCFKLKVSGMVYAKNPNTNSYITTIDGKNYYYVSGLNYENYQVRILRSEEVTTGDTPIARINSVENINIEDGLITFEYDDVENVNFVLYYSKSSQDIKSASVEIMEGVNYVNNTNKFTYHFPHELEKNSDYNLWIKAVSTAKDRVPSVVEKCSKTIYKLPEFQSNHIEIIDQSDSNTYKFKISLNDYSVGLNSINGTRNYYKFKVLLSYEEKEKEIIIPSSDDMSFTVVIGNGIDGDNIYYIPDNISLKVTPLANSTNRVLNGEESQEFNYRQLSWSEEDEITWNEERQEFEWTYGKATIYKTNSRCELYQNMDGTISQITLDEGVIVEPTRIDDEWSLINYNNQDYYLKNSCIREEVTYKDTTGITFVVEIKTLKFVREDAYNEIHHEITRIYEDITKPAFSPMVLGKVQSIGIKIKGGINDFTSPKKISINPANVNLYAGGSGTEIDPYVISNEEQFNNINLRAEKPDYMVKFKEKCVEIKKNKKSGAETRTLLQAEQEIDSGSKIYFKQNGNLIINASETNIYNAFGGSYDGGGYEISISGGNSLNIDHSVNTGTETIAFSKGVALFDRITSNGQISNLNLVVNYNYQSSNNEGESNNSNTIMAGLVVYNEGKISGVNVKEFNFTFESGLTQKSILAVSGIVGINKGSVNNCENSAETVITNNLTSQTGSAIYFGGISAYNLGSIQQASNKGNKSLDIKNDSNVSVYMAGVTGINNGGILDLCYNTANITVKNRSTVYSAGLTAYTKGGKIKYSFNTGVINAKASAGIAYILKNTEMVDVLAYGSVIGDNKDLFFVAGEVGNCTNCYTYTTYNDRHGIGSIITKVENYEIIHDVLSVKIVVTYDATTKEYNGSVESI